MTLNEYIKQSYLRPNKAVLKSLGASDELIEYLLYTPWNTNMNVVAGLINNTSGDNNLVDSAIVGTATAG